MDLLLKILKIGALLVLILVLAILFAPTLKGPFVVIHFSTALRGWMLAQLALAGLALAARMLFTRLLTPVRRTVTLIVWMSDLAATSSFSPMRC